MPAANFYYTQKRVGEVHYAVLSPREPMSATPPSRAPAFVLSAVAEALEEGVPALWRTTQDGLCEVWNFRFGNTPSIPPAPEELQGMSAAFAPSNIPRPIHYHALIASAPMNISLNLVLTQSTFTADDCSGEPYKMFILALQNLLETCVMITRASRAPGFVPMLIEFRFHQVHSGRGQRRSLRELVLTAAPSHFARAGCAGKELFWLKG
jgi:hypothetical protein